MKRLTLLLTIGIIIIVGCSPKVILEYSIDGSGAVPPTIGKGTLINLQVKDVRSDPEVIGFGKNNYDFSVEQVKLKNPDLAKDIFEKLQTKFTSFGYQISESSPRSLYLFINHIEAIGVPKRSDIVADGEVRIKAKCMNSRGKTTYERLYRGHGKGSAFSGSSKPVKAAVETALKVCLSQIVFDTNLHRALAKTR